ncbi:fibronectin type III domain-containing protein [Bifidobacterium actinocoloniiforme DSM 22766]|uniref:Fibronectin type III domain-containing protein n=1 Tax=Bifidobacterium actinocoloniiforme DSM 22766 TaxID=1437605 RepID=A0A086YZG6_9BIFI|nr:Ig-like domain-containing protein [Bifidobacterium actinocoloniiforme]KFI39666.1 fibronectin type III domain-containing protein [Bifidobacterium actinocoloniiforme DSM 22766]
MTDAYGWATIRPRPTKDRRWRQNPSWGKSKGDPRTALRLRSALALLLAAALATAVILVPVSNRQQADLDDGTVWVASASKGKLARFNPRIREADAMLPAPSPSLDLAQSGGRTFLRQGRRLSTIDPVSLKTSGSTDAPASVKPLLSAGTLAAFDQRTGQVWAGSASFPPPDLAHADPVMALGRGGQAAIGADGTLYGYRADDGAVLTLSNPAARTIHQGPSLTGGRRLSADALAVVQGQAVVLSGRTMRWKNGSVQLPGQGPLELQSSPVDQDQKGSWIAATDQGHVFIADLDQADGSLETIATGSTGRPARPVSSGGCLWAAWSSQARNFTRLCGTDGGRPSAPSKPGDGPIRSLDSITPGTRLMFRANKRQVVLNDIESGSVWDPDTAAQAVNLSWDPADPKAAEVHQTGRQKDADPTDFSASCKAQEGSIRAEDDHLAVRAGSRALLDPLANDQETGCALASISRATASDQRLRAEPAGGGRFLQVDASDLPPGSVRVSYTASDGRGHSSSASIALQVLPRSDNRPPAWTGPSPDCRIAEGSGTSLNALAGFTDPDGDPLALLAVQTRPASPLTATVRADGRLDVHAANDAAGPASLEVQVSDGRATSSALIDCQVSATGSQAPVAGPLVLRLVAGQTSEINLSPAVQADPNSPLQLDDIQHCPGVETNPLPGSLTVRARAERPGDYYLPYTVSQAGRKSQGLIRLQAIEASSKGATAITADDTAVLDQTGQASLDPLANDFDPTGGPLILTGVDTSDASGIKAGVAEGRWVRLEAKRSLTGPVTIRYQAANQAGSSQASITILPAARQSAQPALRASDIQAQVRQGGSLTIAVMDHVSSPTGAQVSLSPKLEADAGNPPGQAFVSGESVRYLAGDQAGRARLTYTVSEPGGGSARGSITIDIHPSRAEGKAPSRPRDLEARTVAGGQVRIPIPLTGIDQDGDDTALVGLGSQLPRRGRVLGSSDRSLLYEAYPDSRGTDEFTYQVEDWTGQPAQARIRVGIAPSDQAPGLMARDDHVRLRPGVQTDVPVTGNDVSSDGLEARLDPQLEGAGPLRASARQGGIHLTSPSQTGESYLTYTVRNAAGMADQASLRVSTSPDAPILPPQARDCSLTSADWEGGRFARSMDALIANPSGPNSDLTLSLGPQAQDQANLRESSGSWTLTANPSPSARAIPYTVTNTRYNVSSIALIRLPAVGSLRPSPNPHAPPLTVAAGSSLTIAVSAYAQAGSAPVRVVSPKSVQATKSDGSDPYLDPDHLRFTPAHGYSGPASITFTAAAQGPSSAVGSQAVLTLPIEVNGEHGAPPTFTSPLIDLEAGGQTQHLALKKLTRTTSQAQAKALIYDSPGFKGPIQARLRPDGDLTFSASRNAALGQRVRLPFTIRYPGGKLETALTLRIVASRKPLASVPDRRISLAAGHGIRLNALDGAYNPLPDRPLSLAAATSDQPGLTARIQTGGWVELNASDPVEAANGRVILTVSDGTGAPERRVTASIIVDFINRPRPPSLLASSLVVGDGSVSLAWIPGAAMGSPILEYQVTYQSPAGSGSHSCGQANSCTLGGLVNAQTYSFMVRARNAQGWSNPSAPLAARPDARPQAPEGLIVDGSAQEELRVSWRPARNRGSRITSYQVNASGPGCGPIMGRSPSSTQAVLAVPHDAAGSTCTISVNASNQAGSGPAATAVGASWSSPDAPVFEQVLHDQPGWPPGRVQVTLKAGRLHGGACQAVDLTASQGARAMTVSWPCAQEGASLGGVLNLPVDPGLNTITLEAVTRAQGQPPSNTSPTARALITLEGRR